jgi:hypothetical protein
VKCKSCGSELVSDLNTCLTCGAQVEVSPLPAEDNDLPTTPWNQSKEVEVVSRSLDRPWTELRSKILIDESHKERTWTDDFLPFKQYLRKRGSVIVEAEGPLTGSKLDGVKMVVVGGPEKSWLFDRKADQWHDDEVVQIQQYVKDGGCLLVMGDKLSDAEKLSALTQPFGMAFTRETVGDVTVHRADMARHPILEGVTEFRLGIFHGSGGYLLNVIEPAFALAWMDGQPVLAACYFGHGMVVAISNLMVFSERYLFEANNEVFLEKLVDEVLRENKTKKVQRVDEFEGGYAETLLSLEPTEEGTYEEVELLYPEEHPVEIVEEFAEDEIEGEFDTTFDLDAEDEESGAGFEECEPVWRDTLDELIEVWQTWEATFEGFSADYETVDEAEYPEDRELLRDVWERDIDHWQPKFIELMERELSLWGDMYAQEEIDKVSRTLLHDLLVNRKTAIVQREQQVEILKNQLEAMESGDTFAVEELFEDATDVSYAAALLRNDYVDLLQNLKDRGLPIPEEHVPESEEMEKEDWERGWSLIEWMQPILVPENGKVQVGVPGDSIDESAPMLDLQQIDVEGDGLSDQDNLNLKAA